MTTSNTAPFMFDGHEYEIVHAEIVAAIPDPYWCNTYNDGKGKSISWSIQFDTESDDDELSSDDDELFPPSVELDLQVDVWNWHDLVGYETEWTTSTNPKTNDRYGLVYVYDHQLITRGRLRITSRTGTTFQVVASGLNEEGQTFRIDAPAEFVGIHVRGSEKDTEDSIHARLTQYVDDANLVAQPFELQNEYDSGVKMGTSLYRPSAE